MVQVTVALLIGVAISPSAHASENNGVPDSFNYYDVENVFEHKTVQPEAPSLLGTWVVVGWALLPGYSDPSVPQEGYDPNGIRNGDGSFQKLMFSTQESFGQGEYLAVELLNLGQSGVNQGPASVTYNQEGVNFPRMFYDGMGEPKPVRDGFLQVTCRSLPSKSRILCRHRVVGIASPPDRAAYNGRVVYYTGHKKQDPPCLDP